jgi:anti-sigma-K factor RskA
MNTQERMNDKRIFRIAAIAVAATAVLALAAYLFGNSLRADTPTSVAPSAALSKSRSEFYADLNHSAAAARSASQAALAKSRADFYAELNNSAAEEGMKASGAE